MRAIFANSNNLSGWTMSSITSYYFLLIPAAGLLMTHPEHPIVRDDIEKGELAGRLLKPFSYFWQRFYIEIPVRIFQGFVGIFLFILLTLIYGNFMQFRLTFSQLVLILVMIVLAYLLCFTFKMITAIIALWTTDNRGLKELVEILIIMFAGYLVPINLLPGILEKIAYLLPFPYIIYYPVMAVQGSFPFDKMLNIIGIQLIWLISLVIIFNITWRRGLKRFTDLGH
jgi:ABC-2 type transport system permease protein